MGHTGVHLEKWAHRGKLRDMEHTGVHLETWSILRLTRRYGSHKGILGGMGNSEAHLDT